MVQKVKITEVFSNPNNPRIIKGDKFKKLVQSIKDFPEMLELRPIVIDENNIVLGGNMRLRACTEAGLTDVPVTMAKDLTEEQKKEFIVKDNVGFGEWDWDILANEWDAVKLEDWGLEGFPFEDVLEAEEDDYSEPDNMKVDVVLGDLIEIGEHRLLCGDSTDSDQVAKLMNGEKADLGHNDPPYGMKKENDGVLNDNLNYDDLLAFNKQWIPLQLTHLKSNGSWYCWGIDEPLMDIYYEILKPYKTNGEISFRNLITWTKFNNQKPTAIESMRSYVNYEEKCLFVMLGVQSINQTKDLFPEEWRPLLDYFKKERDAMGWKTKDVVDITGKTSASHYFSESQFQIPSLEHYTKIQEAANGKAFEKSFDSLNKESSVVLTKMKKSRAYFNNTHETYMTTCWNFPTEKQRENTGEHATPKPIALCERVIKSSCPDSGLVLDVFLGSGSTMVAAHQLKRKCYGMELDPKYCQVIIDRMQQLDDSLEIKINGKRYDKN